MSFDIAAREENIELNNMHAGIQLLLNEQPFQPPPLEQRNCGPLEQCNFGDLGYNSRLPEDRHTSMTGMFERHLQTQDNPFPNSHNGSMSWDEVSTGTYDDFRSSHADFHISTGTGDHPDTLYVLRHALRTSLRRDQVHEVLQSLLYTLCPPWSNLRSLLRAPLRYSIQRRSKLVLGYDRGGVSLSCYHVVSTSHPGCLEMEMAGANTQRRIRNNSGYEAYHAFGGIA